MAYPQTNTDNNSNEGLLRQLWHHIWAHYFKRLEQEEMRRLHYLRLLLPPAAPPDGPSAPIPALLPDLTALLHPNYLSSLLQSYPGDRDTSLWLKTLQLNLTVIGMGDRLDR